jgi:CheY-like chemotaxis protein
MKTDRQRILVAEDNPGLARVLAIKLQQAGFDLVVCHDGAEAWDAIQRQPFDAVLTDYEMPRMTGEQLCRSIRACRQYAEIPVVMTTARELELDVPRIKRELNLAAIYGKPYSVGDVVLTIGRLVKTVAAEGVPA